MSTNKAQLIAMSNLGTWENPHRAQEWRAQHFHSIPASLWNPQRDQLSVSSAWGWMPVAHMLYAGTTLPSTQSFWKIQKRRDSLTFGFTPKQDRKSLNIMFSSGMGSLERSQSGNDKITCSAQIDRVRSACVSQWLIGVVIPAINPILGFPGWTTSPILHCCCGPSVT